MNISLPHHGVPARQPSATRGCHHELSLLPAVTGRDSWPEIALQQMFLPVRCGGLGLPDVANVAASEYTASIHVCAAYMNAILQQTAHPTHQPKSLNWSSRIADTVQKIRDAITAAKAQVKLE